MSHSIQCRDALIAFATNLDTGQPSNCAIHRRHPQGVPLHLRIDNCTDCVSAARWPDADFIVGNPPFIGNKRMRSTLGNNYCEALRAAYPELPESCDLAMYFWHKAAELARSGAIRGFGFITTNSITQVFSRKVVAMHLAATPPLHLAFAVPDHPWVDASDGAAVRIAMTVCQAGSGMGTLSTVTAETESPGREVQVTTTERRGVINANLTVGADVSSVKPLRANADVACRGVTPVGRGFVVTKQEARKLGLGCVPGLEKHIRPVRNGKDITDKPRGAVIIDLHGLEEDDVQKRFPNVYQWLLQTVKPTRDRVRRAGHRNHWWVFGEPRKTLRAALVGLSRYIVTVYVSKHRFFLFLPQDILPDDGLVAIASDDAYHLGVLSSRFHVAWSLAVGGALEDRPSYNNSVCFSTFPFPTPSPQQQQRIRDLGERLDAHRKTRMALHPDLTMTAMYNVLAALRAGRALSVKEKGVEEKGLVGILRELHDELDEAVAEAYGWSASLGDEEILVRLVALNQHRAREEQQGVVQWLRVPSHTPTSLMLLLP